MIRISDEYVVDWSSFKTFKVLFHEPCRQKERLGYILFTWAITTHMPNMPFHCNDCRAAVPTEVFNKVAFICNGK